MFYCLDMKDIFDHVEKVINFYLSNINLKDEQNF